MTYGQDPLFPAFLWEEYFPEIWEIPFDDLPPVKLWDFFPEEAEEKIFMPFALLPDGRHERNRPAGQEKLMETAFDFPRRDGGMNFSRDPMTPKEKAGGREERVAVFSLFPEKESGETPRERNSWEIPAFSAFPEPEKISGERRQTAESFLREKEKKGSFDLAFPLSNNEKTAVSFSAFPPFSRGESEDFPYEEKQAASFPLISPKEEKIFSETGFGEENQFSREKTFLFSSVEEKSRDRQREFDLLRLAAEERESKNISVPIQLNIHSHAELHHEVDIDAYIQKLASEMAETLETAAGAWHF